MLNDFCLHSKSRGAFVVVSATFSMMLAVFTLVVLLSTVLTRSRLHLLDLANWVVDLHPQSTGAPWPRCFVIRSYPAFLPREDHPCQCSSGTCTSDERVLNSAIPQAPVPDHSYKCQRPVLREKTDRICICSGLNPSDSATASG